MIATSESTEMGGSTYNLSFTAGGLLFSESLVVADEHDRAEDWAATAERVERHNLLQARTESAGRRILREVCSRLRLLTSDQLKLLQSGSRSDQQQLLWVAACKRYELLYQFGSEVITNKFLQLDLSVSLNDFEDFLEAKCIWHPEIEKLAASTRAKLRQVAFRMLREADILSNDNLIQPVFLSPEIARVIQSDSMSLFSVLPVSESDIRAALS
jgi:hypothetical protein